MSADGVYFFLVCNIKLLTISNNFKINISQSRLQVVPLNLMYTN